MPTKQMGQISEVLKILDLLRALEAPPQMSAEDKAMMDFEKRLQIEDIVSQRREGREERREARKPASLEGISEITGLNRRAEKLLDDAHKKLEEIGGTSLFGKGADAKARVAADKINADLRVQLSGLAEEAEALVSVLDESRRPAASKLAKRGAMNIRAYSLNPDELAVNRAAARKMMEAPAEGRPEDERLPGRTFAPGMGDEPAPGTGRLKVHTGRKAGFEGEGTIEDILAALQGKPRAVGQTPAAMPRPAVEPAPQFAEGPGGPFRLPEGGMQPDPVMQLLQGIPEMFPSREQMAGPQLGNDLQTILRALSLDPNFQLGGP